MRSYLNQVENLSFEIDNIIAVIIIDVFTVKTMEVENETVVPDVEISLV